MNAVFFFPEKETNQIWCWIIFPLFAAHLQIQDFKIKSAMGVFNPRSQSGLSAVAHWLGRSDINKTQPTWSDYCHWNIKCEIPGYWSVRSAMTPTLSVVRSFCWRLFCHPQLYKFHTFTLHNTRCAALMRCIISHPCLKRSPDALCG